MICDRCSNQVKMLEKCEMCGKMICRDCEKSSKKVSKTKRSIICKDCWGDMEKRKKWKSM